jgi:hypothetical protein
MSGDPSRSKPARWNTSWSSATPAFFVLPGIGAKLRLFVGLARSVCPILAEFAPIPGRTLVSGPRLGINLLGCQSRTDRISQLEAGDHAAAHKLWEGNFMQMVRLAGSKSQGIRRRAAGEKDAALSPFDSFCRGVQEGRFPQLSNRDDLWQVLVVPTDHKAMKLVPHQRRQRGGGTVQCESAFRPCVVCRVSLRFVE